jgi:hypothetical protein
MRALSLLLTVSALSALTGCAQLLAQDTSPDSRGKFKKCMAETRATPEGRMLAPRLWMEDSSDAVEKLLDPNPLTPTEREALAAFHNRAVQCRQIVLAHAKRYTAGQAPFFQDYARRADAIFYKLANGQIPVGLANRLTIESDRKLLEDLANGRGDAVSAEETERQRSLDAMITASNRLAAAQTQSGPPAPTCTWLGNALYCATPH